MHFAGTSVSHHAHDFLRGGARRTSESSMRMMRLPSIAARFGRVLHAHAKFTHALSRLNEGAADIVVADNAELERHPGELAVTDRSGDSGIRHRHHDIDVHMAFTRKLRSKGFADLVDGAPADDGIGPREIDVFEDARPRRHAREGLVNVCMDILALVIEHDDFARLDVTDIFRTDDIERAGLRRQNRTAVPVRPAPAGGCRGDRARRSASCW